VSTALPAALLLLVCAAATASAQTVTASWDRNADSYTAGYRLYYGTASGSYQWSVDAGNQVSAPINLSPGNVYYFAVRAYNAQYEYGPASNETSIDLRATTSPTAQITATLGANNVATVTWQTTNANSATINGTAVGLSGTTTVTVSSPTTFTIVARNAAGQTATASATVTPSSSPSAPTAQISSTLGANNLATLTWQTTNATSATINGGPAPALSGTATITVNVETSFTLVAANAAGQTATAVTIVRPGAPTTTAPTALITATLGANNVAIVTWQTANATSATINGAGVALSGTSNVTVTGDTTFTLIARNAAGQTATASATVTATSPLPGTPTSMAASVVGTRATLSWRPPTTGAAPSTYVVDVGTTSGGSDIARSIDVGNVLSVAGDLGRGTYYARVRAANGAGVSPSSSEVRFSVGRKLRTPSSLAVNWTGTTATLSWTPPSADGVDEAATSYVIEAGTSPGSSNVGTLNVGNTTSFRADVASGTYYVRVRALNDVGESDPSDDVEVRAPGAPHAPTELVSNGSSGEVNLSWSGPRGGPAPAGFVIEAGSAPGLTDLASLSVGNVTSFTTTAPPGVYYVRVRAVNDRGTSGPTNEVVVQR
jgi:hypothetical protein